MTTLAARVATLPVIVAPPVKTRPTGDIEQALAMCETRCSAEAPQPDFSPDLISRNGKFSGVRRKNRLAGNEAPRRGKVMTRFRRSRERRDRMIAPDLSVGNKRCSHSNTTPIRRSLRQTTRQGRCRPSLGRTSVNFSGMPTGLATSSAAPLFDTLRMVQSIALPPNSIVPALNTRFR
jgi:hypothetical protein